MFFNDRYCCDHADKPDAVFFLVGVGLASTSPIEYDTMVFLQELLRMENDSIASLSFGHLPVQDRALALQRTNHQETLADELFGMLIKSLPEDRHALVKAFEANAWPTLRGHLHRLYGATLYCGVPQLEATTKHLQIQIKADQSQQDIQSAFTEVLHAMDTLLELGQSKT